MKKSKKKTLKATGTIDFNDMESAIKLTPTITNFNNVAGIPADKITYRIYAMKGKNICQDSWVVDPATGEVTNSFSCVNGVLKRGVIDESLSYSIEPVVEINGQEYICYQI